MGRVLPVTKHFKSLIPRKPQKEGKEMNRFECPICGKERVDDMCPHCRAYHAPQKCTGEGCEICAEIKYLKNSLLSPPA